MALKAIAGGDGAPAQPDWKTIYADELDAKAARAAWSEIIRELQDAQTLAPVNGHAVKRLVEFRVQYDRASRLVAEEGPVQKAKRTGVPQYNPQWTIMRQADEAIRVIESELGLAPTRRSKAAKVQRAKKAPRASDAYLKKVG